MLEEGNEACSNRNKLFRRDIHIINPTWIDFNELSALTRGYAFIEEATFLVDGIVGLSNEISLFLVSSKIFNSICDLTLFYHSVRSLDKSEFVDPCVCAHGVNETNIRTLWSLNWANTAIVGSVHIPNFETSTITIETTRSKSRKTALVGKLGEGVCLVHELGKLRPSKEVANNCAECLRVYKLLWRHTLDVDIKESHALFHQTLGAGETDTTLIGKKFANRTNAT